MCLETSTEASDVGLAPVKSRITTSCSLRRHVFYDAVMPFMTPFLVPVLRKSRFSLGSLPTGSQNMSIPGERYLPMKDTTRWSRRPFQMKSASQILLPVGICSKCSSSISLMIWKIYCSKWNEPPLWLRRLLVFFFRFLSCLSPSLPPGQNRDPLNRWWLQLKNEVQRNKDNNDQVNKTVYQFNVHSSSLPTLINAKHLPIGRCCLFRT